MKAKCVRLCPHIRSMFSSVGLNEPYRTGVCIMKRNYSDTQTTELYQSEWEKMLMVSLGIILVRFMQRMWFSLGISFKVKARPFRTEESHAVVFCIFTRQMVNWSMELFRLELCRRRWIVCFNLQHSRSFTHPPGNISCLCTLKKKHDLE